MVWFGLVWFGLVWLAFGKLPVTLFSHTTLGFILVLVNVWFWLVVVRCGLVWFGLVCLVSAWFG